MMETFSCDIETDGLSPTVVWCVAVQDVYSQEVQVFYDCDAFNDWINSGDVFKLAFHNGIAFDVPVLEELWGTDFSNIEIHDTLLLSQLDNHWVTGVSA